ncbi:MAG: flagellar assembly protein FliX [Rickettsiales endosymbiont of Dermacentor nuttalli]
MKIEQYYNKSITKLQNTNVSSKKRKVSDNLFNSFLDEISALDNVQKVHINEEHYYNKNSFNLKESSKKCNQLLSILKNIQISLLQGNIKQKDLLDLKHLLYFSTKPNHSILNNIINEIELRAAIELAKLEQLYPTEI